MKVITRIGLSVLMLVFLSIGLCYAQNVAGQNTAKGVDYAAQGKFKEANEKFAEALRIEPSFGPAQRASKIIKDVFDQKIESQTAVHYFRGISFAIKGQYDQAISEYNKAVSLNPAFASAYTSRGVAYAQSGGQYDQAISDFSKAIEISPQFAKAYKDRGFAYYKKGQYDQAISDYGKAIEIHPKFADAYFNRAVAYYSKGEYEKAWGDVHTVQSFGLQVSPRFIDALRAVSGRQG
ncbi:MAG: tetratricopeptide repeat protein [Deltaproteobacteria bacterium]|nr:tetratricopeptide repeat protein [Deltaproteobacteria bacterium]